MPGMNDRSIEINRIHARYKFRKKIAAGGFGDVFHATDKHTGRDVAVKMIQISPWASGVQMDRPIARFRREMALYTELNHPSIVNVVDSGETENGVLYIAFEYIAGWTLARHIRESGALSIERAKNLMTQVLEGLSVAHEKGIIHRDLKPVNVMIVESGGRECAKILDFGLASFINREGSGQKRLSIKNGFLGTPAYASPEQLRGEPISVKSDLYAWGLLFLECLTGRSPYAGESVAEVVQQQLSHLPVPIPLSLSQHRLGSLLSWVVEKQTDRRAGNSAHVLTRLRTVSIDDLVEVNEFLVDASSDMNRTSGDGLSRRSSDRASREQRQVTVLSFSLSLADVPKNNAIDVIDEIYSDLIDHCAKVVEELGGYISGNLDDRIVAYFGYPSASDTDARRAALAALKLSVTVDLRRAILVGQYGIRITPRFGIHTGMVTIRKKTDGQVRVSGLTPSVAGTLCTNAPEGAVLMSGASQRLMRETVEYEAVPVENFPALVHLGQVFRIVGERRAEESVEMARSAMAPFVGREGDVERLRDAYINASTERARPFLLLGEAGIGKSRLTTEFLKSIAELGGKQLACRCIPEASNSALHPILELFKAQWGLRDKLESERSVLLLEEALSAHAIPLDQSMPLFCLWLGLPCDGYAPLEISPQRQKARLLNYSAEILSDIAVQQKAMIILEDLHWGDPTTIEFLPKLFEQVKKRRVFLLMTARPTFSPGWKTLEVKTDTLESLEESAVDEMIRRSPEGERLAQTLITKIIERADGVPLYVEELVKIVTEKEPSGRESRTVDAAMIEIPDTIRDLLTGRLDRLGPAKTTAQLAATLGRTFDYNLLTKVSLADEAVILADLDQLISDGLIHMRMRVGNPQYQFHHALLRDAAYETLGTSDRVAIHMRIAYVLEQEFEEIKRAQPEVLAAHWAAAGQYEKAADYGLIAAGTAISRSLYTESLNHARSAAIWARKIEDHALSVEKELSVNQVSLPALTATVGFGGDELLELINRSEELQRDMPDDPEYLFPLLWSMLVFYHSRSEYDKRDAVVQRVLKLIHESGDKGKLAAVNAYEGHRLFSRGKFRQAVDCLKAVENMYDSRLHRNHAAEFGHDTKIYALSTLGLVLSAMGLVDEAEEAIARGHEWAKELNSTQSTAMVMAYELGVWHYRDEPGSVQHLAKRLAKYSSQHDLPVWLIVSELLLAWTQGDIEQAEKSVKTIEMMGIRQFMSYWNCPLAQLELHDGNAEKAMTRLNHYIDQALSVEELFYLPELYRLRAHCHQLLDPQNFKAVVADIEKSVSISKRIGAGLFELRALLDSMELLPDEKRPTNRKERIIELLKNLRLGKTIKESQRAQMLIKDELSSPLS